jgi:hypothetical protein
LRQRNLAHEKLAWQFLSSLYYECQRDSHIPSRPKEEGLHAKAASPPTRRSCAAADSTPVMCTPGCAFRPPSRADCCLLERPTHSRPAFRGVWIEAWNLRLLKPRRLRIPCTTRPPRTNNSGHNDVFRLFSNAASNYSLHRTSEAKADRAL